MICTQTVSWAHRGHKDNACMQLNCISSSPTLPSLFFGFPVDRRDGINTSVTIDVQMVFKGKTYSQLQAMNLNIESKIHAGGSNLDIGYWESLLQQVRVFMARARYAVFFLNERGTLAIFIRFPSRCLHPDFPATFVCDVSRLNSTLQLTRVK